MDRKKRNASEVFIDSHVHIFPQDRLRGLMRWILRLVPEHPVPESVTAKMILDEMRREGIAHFFNLVYPLKEEETDPLNAFNGRFCSAIPGPSLSRACTRTQRTRRRWPRRPSRPTLSWGSSSTLLSKASIPGTSGWIRSRVLEEAERPVILHTGFDDYYGKSMPSGNWRGYSSGTRDFR